MVSLFIFRRDLRLEDNTGLLKALKESDEVICAFIFDLRQKDNDYFSSNAFEFMINSLKELNELLKEKGSKLYMFKGYPENVIADLKKFEKDLSKVFVNEDYTPFSKKRDAEIRRFCKDLELEFVSCHDLLLQKPGQVLKDDNKPYSVFTPFYNKSIEFEVQRPIKNEYTNYYKKNVFFNINFDDAHLKFNSNPNILVKGSRSEGLSLLNDAKKIKNYEEDRNFPSIKGTSKLSAHHKFGTISIRESYHFIKKHVGSEPLLRELYWRDFYTHLAYFFPEVFKHNFKRKYDVVSWREDELLFKKWCKGETGYPIVDAGMKELNTTGYMHNRVRMIVSSFLTKNLLINWKLGERYFATKLVDYDPCVNNGSWQWAASTGADSQPYFRIFNPWSQQKKFDKECIYIKKWVKKLENLSAKQIHDLENDDSNYIEKIIDYKKSRIDALNEFKKA